MTPGNSVRAQRAITQISNTLGANPIRGVPGRSGRDQRTALSRIPRLMWTGCFNWMQGSRSRPLCFAITRCTAALVLFVGTAQAQDTQSQQPGADASTAASQQNHISCASQPGERQHCTADTSAGVALVNASGAAPCLLGKTWGYDDTGIWVSDGCGGEFVAGQTTQQAEKKKPLEHVPNLGFLLYDGEKGQIYFRSSAIRGTSESTEHRCERHGCLRRRAYASATARTSSSRSFSRRSAAGS
jgi:hypothetical protein